MRFFELRNNDRYSSVLWDSQVMSFESVRCPKNDRHRHPGSRIGDLHVILKSSRTADIMWTVYSECLASNRVSEIFKSEKLTGYDLLSVEISNIKGDWVPDNKKPRFRELQLRGWGGMAKPESGVKLLKFCKHCGLSSYRRFDNPSQLIDESQWDGSDFFMVWPLPRFVFVTEKVKDIVEREKLSGCKLIPVEELPYSTEKEKVGTLSPGCLRNWMPEKRARELGEPLGIY